MRIVVAPDKFKGSLTAVEVGRATERGIKRFAADIDVTAIPMADGGEGTLDLLIPLLNLEVVKITVHDPLFRPVEAYYGKKGSTAYVEMAKASGLELLNVEERNALRTTSYGTGELIRHAVEQGATEVYVLIGGSASSDAGVGMAQALGYQFLDTDGRALSPVGGELTNMVTINLNERLRALDRVRVRVISDVDNPLYGPRGAAQVYGPQKGATPDAVALLDRGLMNMADQMVALTGKDVRGRAGSRSGRGFRAQGQ